MTATTPVAVPDPRTTWRPRTQLARWTVLIGAVVVAVVMLLPFLLVVINSFKTAADYSQNGPMALPSLWTFDAFGRYFETIDYGVLLWNSVLVAGLVALFGTVVSLLNSYALGIGRVRGRILIVFVLLLATVLPQEALIYPLFYGPQALGLHNTPWSVVIIFVVLQAAMGTYLLASVMGTFPREMIEAAQIDGASRWRTLVAVVTPIMRPTLSVLLVFFFVWTWNEFFIPMIMLFSPRSQTIPIALAALKGQNTLDITQLAAGSLMSLLPTLIFFLIFQRTLTRGVTAGAVK